LFTVWGSIRSGVVAGTTLALLNIAAGFVVYHWGKLPIVQTTKSFNDSVRTSQAQLARWLGQQADVLTVLGFTVLGAIGLLFTMNWHSADTSFFGLVGTWGGHGVAVMTSIVLGILAMLVGLVQYRLSGRTNGWGAQLLTVGIWVVVVASAVPILVTLAALALVAFLIFALGAAFSGS
jgi:hypothetical protein